MAIQLSREGLSRAYDHAGISEFPPTGISFGEAKKRVVLLEVAKVIEVDGCASFDDKICALCNEGDEICLRGLGNVVEKPRIPRTQADNLTMNVKPYQQPVH